MRRGERDGSSCAFSCPGHRAPGVLGDYDQHSACGQTGAHHPDEIHCCDSKLDDNCHTLKSLTPGDTLSAAALGPGTIIEHRL